MAPIMEEDIYHLFTSQGQIIYLEKILGIFNSVCGCVCLLSFCLFIFLLWVWGGCELHIDVIAYIGIFRKRPL